MAVPRDLSEPQRFVLDRLGLLDVWELGQLLAARDVEGVLWWGLEGVGARFFGRFAADALEPFRTGEWALPRWVREQLAVD